MKKKRMVIGGICTVLLICAVAIFITAQNSVRHGLSEGTYSSESDSSRITFDMENDGNISFVYKIHGEATMQGGANIERGKVVLTPDSTEEIYKFEIIDNDYIGFIAKKSSVLHMDDGITRFENGATFRFINER